MGQQNSCKILIGVHLTMHLIYTPQSSLANITPHTCSTLASAVISFWTLMLYMQVAKGLHGHG